MTRQTASNHEELDFDEESEENDIFPAPKTLQRAKRQDEFDHEAVGEDIQNIWQGMMQTVVEGAKEIVKKVAEGFENEQPGADGM
jgi:hypothetical protein